jgi:hypothetical protein
LASGIKGETWTEDTSEQEAEENVWTEMKSFITCSLCQIRMIKSRRMRWIGHVVRMEGKRNAYKIFVGKPEEKRPLRRPRCSWKNIKMDLKETGWAGTECIHLTQYRDQ